MEEKYFLRFRLTFEMESVSGLKQTFISISILLSNKRHEFIDTFEWKSSVVRFRPEAHKYMSFRFCSDFTLLYITLMQRKSLH